MSTAGPIEPEAWEAMNALGHGLDEIIKDMLGAEYGFALLIFKFGAPERMNYISNATREDMVTAMRELAARLEGSHPEEAH